MSVLRVLSPTRAWRSFMFACPNGKLLVYASALPSQKKQLEPINTAAGKMAKLLKLDVELRTLGKKQMPIYVYYEGVDVEPIPIYCNSGEKSRMEDIYAALRNMMFVLSFHPRCSALRHIRKEIMQFS